MKFDNKNKKTGVVRIFAAFKNSMSALRWMLRNETAFKQEVVVLLISIPVLFTLSLTGFERLALFVVLLLVVLVEIVNTAIEATIDRIGLDIHPISGLAKDLGSAAVLVSCGIAGLVWGVVLWN